MKSIVLTFFLFLIADDVLAQRWEMDNYTYVGPSGNRKPLVYDTLRGTSVFDPASNYGFQTENNWGLNERKNNNYQANLVEYDEKMAFVLGDDCVFFSKSKSKIRITSIDGSVQKENDISINKPIIWNRKDVTILKDNLEFEFYLITETNFKFYIYKLDYLTGNTELLQKIDDVWMQPNFKIENGILYYEKLNNKKITSFNLDLTIK